ncbi:glycosyltransferase [Vreelandella sp. F11]|uniref:glycosyltransferase n=1 Tax=Vreelandella sp. F11 TaxID=3394751 RepID=UPI0036DC7AA3
MSLSENLHTRDQQLVATANRLLREKKYDEAVVLYRQAIKQYPALESYLNFNIVMAQNKKRSVGSYDFKEHSENNVNKSTLKCKYNVKVERKNESVISGWAVNEGNKKDVFDIKVEVNGFNYCIVKNDIKRQDLKKHNKSEGLGGFSIKFPRGIFDKDSNHVVLTLPSERKIECIINGSEKKVINFGDYNNAASPISIVVPVYNALEDLKVCVDRLRLYTDKNVCVYLINDASPDKNINIFLETLKFDNQFVVVNNNKNMGFTRTVNKGLELCKNDDVVILNSDARVTPFWLESILFAANTDSNIATVTPMSDRAGAFSAPNIGNDNKLPLGVSEIEYSKAFRRRSIGLYPTVPTGNGFCMFIRRSCINDVGILDEKAFPRGYGEENDFCMRARNKGWRNIIDDRTYVFHDRSKSFGESKNDLMIAGRKIIDKRYPDYKKAISVFTQDLKIKLARFQAKKAIYDCQHEVVKDRCLFVVSTKTGGTPQTNRDLMLALSDSIEPWLLHCDSKILTLYKAGKVDDEVVLRHELSEPVDPLTHTSHEYDRVVYNWLFEFGFSIVHIRHLVWHSLGLTKIAKLAGAKVVKSFHDYYALCPTVKLLDNDLFFCEGDCSKSQAKQDCTFPLWESDALPPLKGAWIHNWRENFSKALQYVDAFVTTSEHAKNIFLDNFKCIDSDRFKVIKHGRDFEKFINPKQEIIAKNRYKILIPGNIDEAKGLNVILSLLERDKDELLEFHILGNARQTLLQNASERLVFHGKYERDQFAEHVAKIKPDVGAVFSIWDETWCHTLTELFSVGLPVFVLGYPTVGDRVKEYNAGWVLKNKQIELVYEEIIISLNTDLNSKLSGVKDWQEKEGKFRDIRWMAAQYHALYQTLSNGINLSQTILTDRIVGVVCPSDRKQVRGNGSTYVRVWERTVNELGNDLTYCRMSSDQLIAGLEVGEIKNLIIQRNALTPAGVDALINSSKNGNVKYLLDLDDDLLNVPESIDSKSIYKNYRPYLEKLIVNANAVTVSTNELKDSLSKYSDKIYTLENKISERLWRGGEIVYTKNNVVVYVGTRTHKEDYNFILPYIEEVAKSIPDFTFRVIGVLDSKDTVPSWVQKVDVPVDKVDYPDFVDWIKTQVPDAVAGIAPLIENEFNNHKSYLKVLEYASLGLPVVASDTIPYRKLKAHMKGLVYANNAVKSDWVNALVSYIENKPYSIECGELNKQTVFEYFSLVSEEKSFAELLNAS